MEQFKAGAYTVDGFCTAHKMSRSALYKAWREGTGPRFFKIGTGTRIGVEAAAAWVAEREAAAAEAHDKVGAEVAEAA